MEQRIVYERYPIFTLDVPKSETDLTSVDALAAHFRSKIEAHHFARFIIVKRFFALAGVELIRGKRHDKIIAQCLCAL